MVVGLRAKGLSINNVHILARAPGVLGPRASRPLNCPITETGTFIAQVCSASLIGKLCGRDARGPREKVCGIRRCGVIVEERQRSRCPPATAPAAKCERYLLTVPKHIGPKMCF